MRTLMALALVFSLSGAPALAQTAQHTSPAAGQSLHELSPALKHSLFSGGPVLAQPLQDSARLAVMNLAAQDYMPGGMHPGFFWSAIGLWSAGAVYLVAGLLLDNIEDDFCSGGSYSYCEVKTNKTIVYVVGGALIGTGVALWIVGKSKAAALGNAQIVVTPNGGIGIRGKYTF